MRFVDLFAGIGGFHVAAAPFGECVLAVENDPFCRKTYARHFPTTPIADDVRDVDTLPPCDVVFAGFPCQPFSIAGVSKYRSLGRPDGFAHRGKGDLFFQAMRLVVKSRPRMFLFENVRNLLYHDGGRTWDRIQTSCLRNGYHVWARVYDAALVVPQHRERVYIVGARADCGFAFPDIADRHPVMRDILEPEELVADKYWLSGKMWEYLKAYKAKHARRGNGFGYGLVQSDGVSRTLSARYYKDGSEILIPTSRSTPRRLMPKECARLMGFPKDYETPVVSDTQAYKQFGNAVVPLVAREIVRNMLPCLSSSSFA